MTIRKPIAWLVLILLTAQILAASADTHAIHQSDNNHQQTVQGDLSHVLDIDHHNHDQSGLSFEGADESCAHCCHCHGGSFTCSDVQSASQKCMHVRVLHYHRLYHSIASSVPVPPPLA